jgi:hypothetical protein
MIDKEGNFQFSGIRSVAITGQGQQRMHIRSNPIIGNTLQLGIDLPQKNTVWIRITDRQGNRILNKQLLLQQGSNSVAIDMLPFTSGLYFVQLQAGGERSTLSFLK